MHASMHPTSRRAEMTEMTEIGVDNSRGGMEPINGISCRGAMLKQRVHPVLRVVLICVCFGLLNFGIVAWFYRSSPPHQSEEAEVYQAAVDSVVKEYQSYREPYPFRLLPKEVHAVSRDADFLGKRVYLITGRMELNRDPPLRRILRSFGVPRSRPLLRIRWYRLLWQESDGTWKKPHPPVGGVSLP